MKYFIQASAALLLCVGTAIAGSGRDNRPGKARVNEVQFSNEDYKLLDTFEGHRLTKADEVFGKGDFKRAYAEYDSFVLEFPQSKALAYGLLRKARCLHLDNKRFEAIKAYREVLDYFPNVVGYAAPALFYTGQAHWESSDNEKAVAAWAQMAADKEYSQHPLGATAFNELGDYLVKQDKADDAARYFQLVAANFRTSNPSSANYAIAQTVLYLVRTKMDEPALRAFYVKVKTFDNQPQRVAGDVAESRDYWGRVMEAVKRYAEFPSDQQALRDRYHKYWADTMDGKFADWDEYQLNIAALRLAYEKDLKKWMERLDKQFTANQKPGDNARVTQWIRHYREHKGKVAEYYGKVDFAKMPNAQLIALMKAAYDDVGDAAMGRSVFNRLPLNQLSDAEKSGLARYFWSKSPDMVKDICMTMQDKELGQMELLRFYASDKDAKNGLPIADGLTKSPTYSAEATQVKADLLYETKQYDKAIAAYQMCDNPPNNLWKIADCYEKLGKLEQAIGQLREVENFFKQHNAEAALRVAHVYRRANQRDQFIAALRAVLKKYPKSGQSSSAHQELEKLGVRIGGGVDANE
jgi:TolA-binding protein